jgi:hypothetical protein
MGDKCVLCGCPIHREGDYAKPSIKGRSHATKHHYIAERFFGRSKMSKGKEKGKPIFTSESVPWELDKKRKTDEFCYECHEELLHNPVFLPSDIERFAELVRLRHFNENIKTKSKDKIGKRIELLQEVIERGTISLLKREKQKNARK